MKLNKDYKEFLELLNEKRVEYLVIGGYALGLHGFPRYTGDIDVWIKVGEANAEKIVAAIEKFGFSSLELKKENFLEKDIIIQLGYPPVRIDIITSIDGVEFDEAYSNRQTFNADGVDIFFIGIRDLIKNKRSSGRPQDIADLEKLEN